jgi:L-amino acid N-acyltransferase YncA
MIPSDKGEIKKKEEIIMEFKAVTEQQWPEIKEIYMEAFPKRERKPYFTLRHSVKKKKAVVMAAVEKDQLLGFTVLIPYKDMIMVDYLAVSSKIRSKGTGSYIMQNVCREYADKKIVLLIECLDNAADNRDQRIARRKFYLKNGFTASDIFIEGASGEMEILNYGGKVSQEDYISLQKYALGALFFKLSGIKIVKGAKV